jgi:hypothetical protein
MPNKYIFVVVGSTLFFFYRKLVNPGVFLAICGGNICESRNLEENLNFQTIHIPKLSIMGPKILMFDLEVSLFILRHLFNKLANFDLRLQEDHTTPLFEFDVPAFPMLPVEVQFIIGSKRQSYIKVNPNCVISASNQIESAREPSLPVNVVQNSIAQVPATSVLKSQQLFTQNHSQNNGQVPVDVLEFQRLASQSQSDDNQNNEQVPMDVLESQRLASQSQSDDNQNNEQVPVDVLESQRLASQSQSDDNQNNDQVPMDILEIRLLSQNVHSENNEGNVAVNVLEKSIYKPIGPLNNSEDLLRELAGPGDLEDHDVKVHTII